MRIKAASKAPQVPSVARLLDIVEFFARVRKPASLSVIATELGLPKSSCLAILELLVGRGYLYEIAPRMGYYPTPRWLENFAAIAEADPIRERIRPALERLHETVGETLVFARRAGTQVVYLDVIESSTDSSRYSVKPGQIRPIHATASGKAILSQFSSGDRRELLEGMDRVSLTDRTITDLDELEREIARGNERGWHVTRGETERDVTGIATCVPVVGEPYALVVAGPSERIEGRVDDIGRLIWGTAKTISSTR